MEDFFASGAFLSIDALRRGISRFAGSTAVSAVLSHGSNIMIGHKVRVYDQQGLLDRHRDLLVSKLSTWPKIESETLVLDDRHCAVNVGENFVTIFVAKCHDSVDSDVIRAWLAMAAGAGPWITSNAHSARSLENNSSRAVNTVTRNYRAQKVTMHGEGSFDVAYIVEELARISRAVEEGKGATGAIVFTDQNGPVQIETTGDSSRPIAEPMKILVEFDKRIKLNDHKHIVKSLQLVKSQTTGYLWADHDGLKGILEAPPKDSIIATFNQGTVNLAYDNRNICRIVGGEISYVLKNPSDLLSPWLGSDSWLPTITETISSCRSNRHGATLALVSELPSFELSGHHLKVPVENKSLIASMASVDGAVILDRDGKAHGYGYIFDGACHPELERLSRGSRFNSGLRFSKRIEDGFVLVVSSDGPITLFQNGKILYADPLSEVDPSRIPDTKTNEGMEIDIWGLLPQMQKTQSGSATVKGPDGDTTYKWNKFNT